MSRWPSGSSAAGARSGTPKRTRESLPINVRVEPFESGIPQSAPETGYTLSFDFASLEDLEQKLAPESATGNSQTSAFEIAGMTFAPNGDLLGLVSVPRDQVQRPNRSAWWSTKSASKLSRPIGRELGRVGA